MRLPGAAIPAARPQLPRATRTYVRTPHTCAVDLCCRALCAHRARSPAHGRGGLGAQPAPLSDTHMNTQRGRQRLQVIAPDRPDPCLEREKETRTEADRAGPAGAHNVTNAN